MWVVRMSLVRDFAALNDVEAVSGDQWGLAVPADQDLNPEDLALLDQAAELANHDHHLGERRSLYDNHKKLHAPKFIHDGDYILPDRQPSLSSSA